jgi:antitoxin (DNA-binding transcriptional repressor) of toxin-antitoxin stability system
MASYPESKFIQEFAKRTSANLRAVRAGRPIEFDDTALIGFLLAVFVLPHERGGSGQFMSEILSEYGQVELKEVVTILRSKKATDSDESALALPESLADIPKFMRHAIAHLNIKPESEDGQDLTYLLVWNRPRPDQPINFVARVHVRQLRTLALHILDRLATGESADKYEHIDPVAEYDKHRGPAGSA